MDIENAISNTVKVLFAKSNVKATYKTDRRTFVMRVKDDKTLIPYANITFYVKGTDIPLDVLNYLYELSQLINKYYDLDIFKYFGILIIEYGQFNRTFNIFYRESKYGRLISGKQKRKGFIITINIPLKKEELLKEIVELNKKYLSEAI